MFKTGTSADARDLYTVALTPKFTLGVWLGNFDGSKTRDLSGGVSAAKVAFNMFAFLDKSGLLGEAEFARPAGVSLRRVCTDAYREKECTQSADDLTIDGVEPNEECEIYGTSELFYLLKHGLIDPQKVRAGRCAAKFAAVKPVLNDINAKTYETGADGFLRLKVQCTAVFGERVYIRLSGGSREFIALNSTAFTGENSTDLDFEHSSTAQQDNLKQNFAEQNSTAQNSMLQNSASQNVKSQNLTKQNSVEWNFIAKNPATRNLASQNSTEQNSEAKNFTAKNFTDQNSSQQNFTALDFTTQSLAPANSKVKTGEYFARTNGEAFTINLGAGDFELGCLDENANFAKANFRVNERK